MNFKLLLKRALLTGAAASVLLGLPGSAQAQDQMCERTVTASVVALQQVIFLNRLGANIPDGMMFALARDVVQTDAGGRIIQPMKTCYPDATQCSPGRVTLRPDKRPRPVVLRANEGDCLQIVFTNLLPSVANADVSALAAEAVGEAKELAGNVLQRRRAAERGLSRQQGVLQKKEALEALPTLEAEAEAVDAGLQPPTTLSASIHVQGMPWVNGPQDDGSFVGANASSLVAPGKQATYTLFAEHEGSYVLYSTADDWTRPPNGAADGGTLAQGLFGSVNIQPSGSDAKLGKQWNAEWYRSQATEQELCLATKGSTYDSSTGLCRRPNPNLLPVIDYQALYPDDPAHFPLTRNLPILNMQCNSAAAAKGACKLNEIVNTDLTAIITGEDAGHFPSDIPPAQQPPALRAISLLPDRLQPYREFTIIYHESFAVDQAFPNLYAGDDALPSLTSAADNFGINYGMGGIVSEILANRIGVGPMQDCVECKYEEFFLSSWSVGDPAMVVNRPATACTTWDASSGTYVKKANCKADFAKYPNDPSNVYPSYMGDHVRFRVLHGGSDLHHVHHQHAHQWLHTPNSPNADYTDSQSIGPGSSFTMEMAYYGSGNVNQTPGDSIFHCHFYAHFASGMWSLWRVFDTLQTGTPINPATMAPLPDSRAYPDGEITAGTPIPAVVPVPTLPMPPVPAPVRLTDGGKKFQVQLVDTAPPQWVNPYQGGAPVAGARNPGYPFFIPGIAGHRAPHPPLDFAYACSDNGMRCSPGTAGEPKDLSLCQNPGTAMCEPLDGGLPRHLIVGGEATIPALNNDDFSKILEESDAVQLAEDGTMVEKAAMQANAVRFRDSCLPDGRCKGACSDNGASCTDNTPAGRWQCANPTTATCDPNKPVTFVSNGLPPKPGAPYADPCIRFSREGGPAPDMLMRRYQAADIQIDALFNKEGWHFPQQRILSLWDDVKKYLDRTRPPEPLFFRANSNDCIEYTLANLVPNVYELDDFQVRTPTDILGQHIHLVKFDVTSSDGAGNGWNYEDGTFAPNEVTERIHSINKLGGINPEFVGGTNRRPLTPKSIKFFGDGPGGSWVGAQATIQRWFADPLYDNAGACSNDPKQACTLIDLSKCAPTATCDVSAGACSDNGARCTASNRTLCGSQKAECISFHDRTLRTVFTHDHFGPSTHQQAGLYAGLVVEPKGSVWRENQTGTIFGGFDPATGQPVNKRFDGGPTTWQAVIETRDKDKQGSFREFLLELQDSTLMYWPFGTPDFILDTADPAWKGQFAGGNTTPCKAGEPCGFCGNDGVCVSSTSGQVSGTGQACDVNTTGLTNPRTCASGTKCLLKTGFLKACTPEPDGFAACSGQAYATTNPNRKGVFKSCNMIAGFPDADWNAWAKTPIDPPGNPPEIVTFFGGTNNFSFNYRNEPLFPRISDPFTGAMLPGKAGDLAYAYSSDPSIQRPNPRGSVCSGNLWQPCDASHPCPSGAGSCQPAFFCSDNYALCTAGNLKLCGSSSARCDQTSPYPPLTADVQGGDPFTPLLRAYARDDIQIRTLTGAHLNPHNFTIQGLNWLMEPSFVDSGWRNSETMGISEHFELLSRLPAASASGSTTDMLYQPGAAALEQSGGNWGILRVYGQQQANLFPLPQNSPSSQAVSTCPATQPAGTKVRTYNVVAVSKSLTYNGTQGLEDPNGLVLYRCPDGTPLASCAPPSNWKPEPLVLRAAAGDCIKLNLRNAIPLTTSIKGASNLQVPIPDGCKNADYPPAPSNCGGSNQPKCCIPSNTSLQVGLRPQLVSFDARTSGGVNVGLNPLGTTAQPAQTAGPGQTVSYTWYAGNIDTKATAEKDRYIPIEFGTANLLPPDVLNHYGHGLFGALIVEPFGSSGWENAGTTATVKTTDGSFKEFVVFTQDNIPMAGGAIEGVNFGSELLGAPNGLNRSCAGCSNTDYSCLYTDKPFKGTSANCTASTFSPATPVFTACAGESVRFRVLHPGGINTNQVFEIYGHNWSEAPYMTPYDHCQAPTTHTNLRASQMQGTTNLCANREYSLERSPAKRTEGNWEASLNSWLGAHMGHGPSNHQDILIAQAGGPFKQAGTYLYRTYPAMHFQLGLWGWFQVNECATPLKPDAALKNQWQEGGQ